MGTHKKFLDSGLEAREDRAQPYARLNIAQNRKTALMSRVSLVDSSSSSELCAFGTTTPLCASCGDVLRLRTEVLYHACGIELSIPFQPDHKLCDYKLIYRL